MVLIVHPHHPNATPLPPKMTLFHSPPPSHKLSNPTTQVPKNVVIVDAKARACSGPGAIDGHNGEGLLCQFGGRSVYLGFLFGYGIWGFIVACFCD